MLVQPEMSEPRCPDPRWVRNELYSHKLAVVGSSSGQQLSGKLWWGSSGGTAMLESSGGRAVLREQLRGSSGGGAMVGEQ